ncbi:MAG: nickel-dependent hydrogenase large subunit [Pseudomonadota bacterium]
MNAPAAATARRYALRLRVDRDAVAASVVREGPADLSAVMRGRTVAEAHRLAGLLFPVCPRAHEAALIRACEAATGAAPSPEEARRRALLVAVEACVAGVWREALTWPAIVGRAGDAARVRSARAIGDALCAALGPGPEDRAALPQSTADAARVRDGAQRLADLVQRPAGASDGGDVPGAEAIEADIGGARPLDAAIERPSERPPGREETPRTVRAADAPATAQLSDWYTAQRRHLCALADRVVALSAAVVAGAAAADDEAAVHNAAAVGEPGGSGAGLGVAMTARGRLRHIVELDGGRIVRWRADAPTDWNFADRGPVALAASRLRPDADLDRCARLLVGAFDPCAPCAVVVEHGGGGHA